MLRAPCQLLDPLHHLPGRSGGRVLKRRRLGADDNVFEFLAQVVAALSHLGSNLRSFGLSRQRVPDEDQFVRAEDDKLTVGHENLGRLVGVDGGEEGVDGVGHRDDILLALLVVEEQQLLVAAAQLGRGGIRRAALAQLIGQGVVKGRDPAGHVIVDRPADFLLEPFELGDLQRDKTSKDSWFHHSAGSSAPAVDL